MDQAVPPKNRGRFAPGKSGNPNGRPPKLRTDSAPVTAPATALAVRAPTPIHAVRRDGWMNSASGHGTARDRRTLTTYGVDIVTDIEAEQLRRSEFLAAAIIEQVPKEALKRDWSLKVDEDKELANAIRKQAEALGLDEVLYEAWTKENEAGGSVIFPVISGAQGDLHTPLDDGAIASVDAFHVFEPQELTPAAYYNDIRSPKFRRPAAYRLQPITSGRSGFMASTIVHETRFVIFPGLKTSKQTQPGQREGWGDSRLCRPRQVMADFGLAWGSAATLLHEHGKGTLEMDGFAHMMAQADGLDEFDRHIAANQMAWTALKMRVVDGKSKFSQATGTLSGVSDVLNEFKSLMAAAAERPVSILMGVGSTGLRSGDDDTRAWYSTVERERSKHLKPRHEQIIRLMLLATSGPARGKEPEAWSVEYPPLWSPSEKEIAETRKTDMDRAVAAIGAEIVSADDVAESFYKGDTYSGDIKVDWKRREAQAKIAEEEAEQLDAEARAALGRDAELADGDEEVPDPEDPPEDEPDGDDEPDEDEDEDEDERTDGWREDKFNPSQPRAADGKFGSGGGSKKPARSKKKPDPAKAETRVLRAGARAEKANAKVANAKAARDVAATRHATAVKAARDKADKAKSAPTARNIKAAESAAAKAGKHAVSLEKHNERVSKHVDAHAKAAAAHEALKPKAPSEKTGAQPGPAEPPAVKWAREQREKAAAAPPAAPTTPTPTPTPLPKPPPKPTEPRQVDHAERSARAVDQATEAGEQASQYARRAFSASQKGDHALAATHLANAERLAAETETHARAAAESAQALGTDKAQRAARNAHDLAEQARESLEQIRPMVNEAAAAERVNSTVSGPTMGTPEYSALARSYAEQLTPDDRHAFRLYSSITDRIVNPALRRNKGKIDDVDAEHRELAERNLAEITAAINKSSLPRDTLAFRVVKDTEGGMFKSLQPGQSLTDHAFTSITADKSLLDKFYKGEPAQRVDMHITLRKGAKAAPINEVSMFQGERELLAQRGSSFRVLKVVPASEGRPHEIHLEME